MWVGMEDSIHENLLEIGVKELFSQGVSIEVETRNPRTDGTASR